MSLPRPGRTLNSVLLQGFALSRTLPLCSLSTLVEPFLKLCPRAPLLFVLLLLFPLLSLSMFLVYPLLLLRPL